jgi:hypothetical protein
MSEWGDKDETFEMLEKVGDKNKVWTKAKKINREQENQTLKMQERKKIGINLICINEGCSLYFTRPINRLDGLLFLVGLIFRVFSSSENVWKDPSVETLTNFDRLDGIFRQATDSEMIKE